MKELTRFEMAVVKRTAQNTKSLRTKRDKLVAKINACELELQTINTMIDKFEQPIKELTGGYTSEEVLNGVNEPESTQTLEVSEVTTSITPEEENADFPFPQVEEESPVVETEVKNEEVEGFNF